MKISEEIKNKGQKFAEQMKVSVLYVNEKGEFFSSENLAQLSVKGDKKKYEKLDFTPVVEDPALEVSVEMIQSLQTVEEVQAILDAEIEGAGDADIMDACEARIKELKEAE